MPQFGPHRIRAYAEHPVFVRTVGRPRVKSDDRDFFDGRLLSAVFLGVPDFAIVPVVRTEPEIEGPRASWKAVGKFNFTRRLSGSHHGFAVHPGGFGLRLLKGFMQPHVVPVAEVGLTAREIGTGSTRHARQIVRIILPAGGRDADFVHRRDQCRLLLGVVADPGIAGQPLGHIFDPIVFLDGSRAAVDEYPQLRAVALRIAHEAPGGAHLNAAFIIKLAGAVEGAQRV